jgi:RNA polymerase sigma-70 factor, ECF subfamily
MTSPAPTLSDETLIRLAANGDVGAFEAIYDRYSAQAFGLAMRVTRRRRAAEEATQEAFLSLWRTAHGYDRRRGAVNTWLLTMVRNRSIDWLRREARHERNLEIDDDLVGTLEADERPEEEIVNREEGNRARQLLTSLPSEQRQVIELAFFSGLTQAEIAAKVNLPLGTVKGRQRLALTKLHRALAGPAQVALSA